MRGRFVVVPVVAAVMVFALSIQIGDASPTDADLRSTAALDPVYDQGITHVAGGWIVSGQNVLGRLDERFGSDHRVDNAIPRDWLAKGYVHMGDIDAEGRTLYVPIEQPDFSLGRQLMARYDVETLRFLDAHVVPQHENSFVAVDRNTGIAYSMDRFDGAALLRYDVRAGWERIEPLGLDRTLRRVQGASVSGGAIWLSTDDARNGVYRADLRTGRVTTVASAPPIAGEGEGIDATRTAGTDLHSMVVAPDLSRVLVDAFSVPPRAAGSAAAAATPKSPSDWPPALVYFAIALALAGLGAVYTIFRRARRTIRR